MPGSVLGYRVQAVVVHASRPVSGAWIGFQAKGTYFALWVRNQGSLGHHAETVVVHASGPAGGF